MCEEEFTDDLRDLESRVEESSDYHYKVRTELLYELITRYGDLVKKVAELEEKTNKMSVEYSRAKDIEVWRDTEAVPNMVREYKTAKAIGCSSSWSMDDALTVALMHFPETPNIDQVLRQIKKDAVDAFLSASIFPHLVAEALADYNNEDNEALGSVIWEGQPPEPLGDVYHLEYVSRGNFVQRALLGKKK